VTQRFNPELARAALVELYGPEDRARIETEVHNEITMAVAAQNEEDSQREGRISQKISQTGSFSRTDEDYVKLDDVGRARVDAALATAQRIKAHDSAGKNLQKQVNRIAMNKWLALPPEQRLAVTDDQLWSSGADEEGVTAIQKERTKLNEAVKKTSLATVGSFNTQVKKLEPLIKERFREHGRLKFMEEVNAWWAQETADGKPPTKEEVNKFVGDLLIMQEIPWSKNLPNFMIHPDRRGDYPDAEEQEYEQAKALLRGDYDRPQAEEAATPAPAQRPAGRRMTGAEWIKVSPGLADKPGFNPDAVYEQSGSSLREVK
jgi:hypothetical protein